MSKSEQKKFYPQHFNTPQYGCHFFIAILQFSSILVVAETQRESPLSVPSKTACLCLTWGSESLLGRCPKWLSIWLFMLSFREVNQLLAWSYTESCSFSSSTSSSASTCGRRARGWSSEWRGDEVRGWDLKSAPVLPTFLSSKYSILAVL